jgi:predicted GIY-YIG superfamily endonuclease
MAADLVDRLNRHQHDRSQATKAFGPWRLVHKEYFASRQLAMKREREIKS